MILAIPIFGTVFVALAVYVYYEDHSILESLFSSIIITGMLVALTLFCLSIFENTREVRGNSYSLKRAAATQHLRGSFFVGSGRIGTEEMFSVYLDQGGGRYQKFTFSAKMTTIVESAGNPTLQLIDKTSYGAVSDVLERVFGSRYREVVGYVLTVPPGSIYESFKLE